MLTRKTLLGGFPADAVRAVLAEAFVPKRLPRRTPTPQRRITPTDPRPDAMTPSRYTPTPSASTKVKTPRRASTRTPRWQTITILRPGYAYGRPGTHRREAWDACMASANVGEYVAKGGDAKYLPRWVEAGAIKLGDA